MQKKHVLLFCILLLALVRGGAQNIAINGDGSLPDSSAILDIKSNSKGILIPRMGSANRLALRNIPGLLVYDTTTLSFWYNNGSAWKNMATTAAATGTGWLLSGNSGTDSSNFIGTTDSTALRIKVANQLSGIIDPLYGNTSWGIHSGSFRAVDSGGRLNVGAYNTAMGNAALYSNNMGGSNAAFGYAALYSNTAGAANCAVGVNSMYSSYGGSLNTASGPASMFYNTTGSANTASGYLALGNNTTGGNNTGIGYGALAYNETGNNNTAIGCYSGVTWQGGGDTLNNTMALGNGATVYASNTIRIGNGAITKIEGQVPFTTPSDGRYKYNVQEDVKGLDFILKLRPVTYQFDARRFDLPGGKRITSLRMPTVKEVAATGYEEAAQVRRTGFIAQEVEKAAIASGYNFSGVVKPASAIDHYSLSYESFVVPLVKAVQEQQQIIADLQQQVKELQQKMSAMEPGKGKK